MTLALDSSPPDGNGARLRSFLPTLSNVLAFSGLHLFTLDALVVIENPRYLLDRDLS